MSCFKGSNIAVVRPVLDGTQDQVTSQYSAFLSEHFKRSMSGMRLPVSRECLRICIISGHQSDNWCVLRIVKGFAEMS